MNSVKTCKCRRHSMQAVNIRTAQNSMNTQQRVAMWITNIENAYKYTDSSPENVTDRFFSGPNSYKTTLQIPNNVKQNNEICIVTNTEQDMLTSSLSLLCIVLLHCATSSSCFFRFGGLHKRPTNSHNVICQTDLMTNLSNQISLNVSNQINQIWL